MRRSPYLFVFLGLVFLIAGSAFWFCGNQLARAFPFGGPGVWGAWTWACALWAFPMVHMVFFRSSAGKLQGLAYFLLGLGATFTVLLLAAGFVGLLLAGNGWVLPSWTPWAVLAATVVLGLRGFQEAYGPARIHILPLASPDLHPGLDGLRIVQISDVHVSHLSAPGQVGHLVDQVRSLKPDLIAVTGDLVDGPVADLRGAAAPLGGLEAPLGVHYVTGNHEYFWGIDGWLREFKALGFELLLNEHRVVERNGAKLLVLGVKDPTSLRSGEATGPDLEAALRGAPKADYTLFLAHQPDAYTLAETAGADLFLAGHTHGGQFFPFPLIVTLFHKYFRGLYRRGRMSIYIHSGSGFWGPPNRLGVPPIVTLFILKRSPA